MNDRLLYFNGIDLDTNHYYRQPMTISSFHGNLQLPSEPDPLRSKDSVSWVDSRDLAESGWGIIVHEREDSRVLKAIEPLLELRRGQVGKHFHSLTFFDRDKPPYQEFFQRHNITHTDVDPEKAPYYLLVVGSPALIPFEFQYELDVSHAVGRIFFESAQAYANYAQNVVDAENPPFSPKPSMTLFSSENDPLTQLCTQKLVLPLAKKLEKVVKGWQIKTIVGPPADKKRLERLMGGADTPALLFTSGHGLAASRDASRRSREQGSLICSDWDGPGTRLHRSHYFGPEDVGPDADYRGSILFHFACFTAGTPEYCGFAGPDKSRRLHEKPFVAPLSCRMLAHKSGPLAIIGHVDQAFQYSFLWDNRVHEISHFAATFHKLATGYPVGAAMEPFNRRFAQVGSKILGEMMSRGPDPKFRLQYWMGYNDARNYLVLGDPAVRLQVCLPETLSGGEGGN